MSAPGVVLCALAVIAATALSRWALERLLRHPWPATDKGRVLFTWALALVASIGDAALSSRMAWTWEVLGQALMAGVLAGGGFSQLRKLFGLDAAAIQDDGAPPRPPTLGPPAAA